MRLMERALGPDRTKRFTCNGVGDYISVQQFEREQQTTTELELLKLRQQLRAGGDYVSVLSPAAQKAVSRWITDDIDENDQPSLVAANANNRNRSIATPMRHRTLPGDDMDMDDDGDH